MSITVADILKLPVFKTSVLVAGAGGLGNVVDGVGLLESADSANWLIENNIVLSNSQVLVQFPELQDELIDRLHRRQAAGIILKMNRFLKEVPAPMKKRADELDFPIICCPINSTSSQQINAISFEIFRSEAHNLSFPSENDFLRYLLLVGDDLHTVRNRLYALGWKPTKKLGLAVIEAAAPETPLAPGEIWDREQRRAIKPDASFKFDDDFYLLCSDAGFMYGFPVNGFFVAILDIDRKKPGADLDEVLFESAEGLMDVISERYPKATFYMGLGRCYGSVLLLRDSFFEAKTALCVNDILLDKRPIIRFGKMGILTVMLDKKSLPNTKMIVDESIGVLIRHDDEKHTEYYKTLRTYYEQGQSFEKTAEKLYVHYNTVRNRLQTISKMVSTNVFDSDADLNLRVFMVLYSSLEHYRKFYE